MEEQKEQVEVPVVEEQKEQVEVPVVEEQKEQVEVPVVEAHTLSLIIKQLHETLEKARALVAEHFKKASVLDQKHADVSFREQTIATRERDLLDREGVCKQVEDLVAYHKSAQDLHNRASLRLDAASEAERKQKESFSVQSQELADLRLITQREAQAVEKQKKAIENEVQQRVQAFLQAGGFIKPEAVVESN